MQWFNNQPVLGKLLGAFGVMCALIIAVGFVGYRGVEALDAELNDRVAGENVPSLIALSQAYINLNAAAKDVRSALLMSDAQNIATYTQKFRVDLAACDKAFSAYVALPHSTTQELSAIADYQAARVAYTQVTDQVLGSAAKNTPADDAAGVEALFNTAAPTLTKIIGSLDTLTAIEQQGVNDAVAAARAQHDEAIRLLLTLLSAAVVFGGAAGVVVARSISVPLAIIAEVAQHAATGETDYDVGETQNRKLHRRDEVGRIGEARSPQAVSV